MSTNETSIWLHVLAAMMRTGRSGRVCPIAATLAKGICLGLLATSISAYQVFAADDPVQLSDARGRALSAHQGATVLAAVALESVQKNRPKRANFGKERASQAARHVADWVVDSGDNHNMPFVIVDKMGAKVFVFDADGYLRGAAPALLGSARGDDAVPGIGNRKLSSILPEERTTPAGRFVASLDRNLHGEEILWVDYDTAVSLHRVITTNIKERRAQRLATATTLDNRISYGCINVPVKFYDSVVSPAFKGTNGIVYVLPETRSAKKVFASYDVDELKRL